MNMQQHLSGFVFGGAVRRWIAAVCVCLFVIGGYAHSTCFVQTGAAVQSVEVSGDLHGGTSDNPAAPTFDGEQHCHGCTAAAMPIAGRALTRAGVVAKPLLAATNELSASDLQFDPPPPKA
jgi:hypothetical protein